MKMTKLSEKSFHKRTPPPPSSGYGIIIEKLSTIEVHRTNG
jgi:hypothetical protein